MNELPTYPTMAACSGATGIPADVLKMAKGKGCSAFELSGRVKLAVLLPWLGANCEWRVGGERLDLGQEQAALARERRVEKERENRIAAGEIITREEALDLIRGALLPVSQQLRALPAVCAHRVNPNDPQFARAALQQWVDDALPQIRKEIGE